MKSFFLAALCGGALIAQTRITDFTATIDLLAPAGPEAAPRAFVGAGYLDPMGYVAMHLALSQNAPPSNGAFANGAGPGRAVITAAMSRLDSFTMQFDFPDLFVDPWYSGPVEITGGAGAYKDARGSGNIRIKLADPKDPNGLLFAGSFQLTSGGRTQTFTAADLLLYATEAKRDNLLTLSGAGTSTALGNFTVSYQRRHDSSDGQNIWMTWTFNNGGSLNAFADFVSNGLASNVGLRLAGGTGPWATASGNATISVSTAPGGGYIATITGGRVVQPNPSPAAAPVITSVETAGRGPGIVPNTWIEIKGLNLTPATTPAGGVTWSDAPDFASGKMPSKLGPVSVTINFRPAYIWWYCSAATTPACASDQINVLTPLESFNGPLGVQVTNGTLTSEPFFVERDRVGPSILLFSQRGDVVATHADGTLVGPAALYPGYSTPARPGETVSIWATGFGLPNETLSEGAATQAGTLPRNTPCRLGDLFTRPTTLLVSPGLYQINLTVPPGTVPGDYTLVCLYAPSFTPLGNLLAIGN